MISHLYTLFSGAKKTLKMTCFETKPTPLSVGFLGLFNISPLTHLLFALMFFLNNKTVWPLSQC